MEKQDNEVHYLYAGNSGGANACVKIVGKVRARAAFLYAARKIEHLLDLDTYYGRGVGYLSETEVGEHYFHTIDVLEGVVLATQMLLEEGENIEDYDMLFVRAVVDFCQKAFPANLLFAPEINVVPPIFISPVSRAASTVISRQGLDRAESIFHHSK